MNDTPTLQYSRRIQDLPGPKGQPWVGNALQLSGRQMHQTFTGWVREFGPMFRLDVFGNPIVIVSDAPTVQAVLKERPEVFRRSGSLKTIMHELDIRGVITAEGDAWRKQRKLVMSGLSAEVIRNFFPTMRFMTERMMDRWKQRLGQGLPVDLRRDLKAMALDVIVGIAMGHDIDAVNDEGGPLQRSIDAIFHRLGQRTTAAFPYWRHVRLPVDRAADRASAQIAASVQGFVRDARARMAQQQQLREKPGNMLEAMIAAAEDPASGFTDEELMDNAVLSVIGGEDTTANSIAWMLHLLAQHPAAAAALTAEVDAVLGEDTLIRDWELMKRFGYLEATFSEAQRLRSVAPYVGVTSNIDCVVADTLIPKNTAVVVATAGEGLDEAQFPDPAAFSPERWIFEQRPPREQDPARKLFPFGSGPRLCPGRFLALTEITMVVSMILRNFELELDTNAPPVREVLNFFMAPSSLPVKLRLRTPSGAAP